VDALGPDGEEGRSRPRKTPVSCQRSVDPEVSEWGNPMKSDLHDPRVSEVALRKLTEGIETSQYLQEYKSSKRFPE
jgi:hypothetical protein